MQDDLNERETNSERLVRLEATIDALHRQLNSLKPDNGVNVPDLIRPPKFDGSTDFITYLKDFNKFATAANWKPQRCVQILPVLLTGDAKYIYDSIPDDEKNTWKKLTDELTKRTQKFDKSEVARRELSDINQGAMTVIEFSNKIRELVERAYADAKGFTEDQRDEIAIDSFRKGLNKQLKEKLLFTEKPTDFTDCVQLAVHFNDILVSQKNENKVDKLEKAIEDIKCSINSLTIQPKPSPNTESNGIYWI